MHPICSSGQKNSILSGCRELLQKHDRWHSTGQAGDLCLMDFGKGRASHIGIVEKSKQGWNIYDN